MYKHTDKEDRQTNRQYCKPSQSEEDVQFFYFEFRHRTYLGFCLETARGNSDVEWVASEEPDGKRVFVFVQEEEEGGSPEVTKMTLVYWG